jgi:hypothetical protein
VVEARSYSRNSGETSCEATTWAPGSRRLTSFATCASCDGSRKEKRRQTATASASISGSDSRSSVLDDAVGPDPLAHAEAPFERDEGRRWSAQSR